MIRNTATLQAFDSLNLFYQSWEPETTPRAAVCLVHGLGEHAERYAHLGEFLVENNFSLHSLDLRGHGKSDGQRGHMQNIEVVLKDIDTLIQATQQRFPNTPIFLYGHSMGGIFALTYPLHGRNGLQGVIASAPGLRNSLESQKGKIFLSKTLSVLAPKFAITTGLVAADITRDPAVLEKYLQDPLVHDRASVSLATLLIRAIQWSYEHAHEFAPPLLLMHGTEDKIAYAIGSQEFAAKVRGDCTLKLWQGLRHEIHNEPEKNQVFAYLINWMESKL